MNAGRHERTVVVAIGGNALSPAGEPATAANQFRHTRESLAPIVEFARDGWRIAIVHGNGPQVGDALLRNERSRRAVDPLPLGVLVAATAGWIGYMVQQSLQNALRSSGVQRPVVTLITQVRVDPADPSTGTPIKFIGRTLDEPMAERLRAEGWTITPDGHGGLRRKVASPEPLEVVESDMVRTLVADGAIVVAAGGGGPPVYRDPVLGWEGIDAVIDKDRAAAILGREIAARVLLILTDVDAVYEAYGRHEARRIPRLDATDARELLASGELGEGSMRPKVEAALRFVEDGGERAIIAALGQGAAALRGEVGTEVVAGS